MRPRIYTYKITFMDTPYYYYGVHKEKRFNEHYMGSPKTHKWCWELYEPEKQILEFFEYSDEGYTKAQETEKQLIKPVFNADKWCLNESCGGMISLEILRKSGKIMGENAKNLRLGFHSFTFEERSQIGKISGDKTKELGVGVHGRTKEQMTNDGRRGGNKTKELGVGFHGRTKEQMTNDGRRGGIISKQNKTGIHSRSLDEMIEHGRKTSTQRWECLETGYITNAGSLTNYQKKRGIDTSKRKRIL